MASPTTASEFLALLRKSGLLTPDEFAKVEAGEPLPREPAKCAAALVKRKVLTPFQARLLLAGKHRGFKLGPYVVLDQLGTGGMGAVFLAQHEALKRKVALKVLAAMGSAGDKLTHARFLREARAAAALDHPNIVRMFDVAQQGDVHYLVMEYVEGDPLDKLLAATGPFAGEGAADAIAQAAVGLQHAHEKEFVHRDIKPANLVVNRDGAVKILDMGLARSNSESDKLTELMDKGAVLGTADFLAPEIALGHPADQRSDIYSLGATFYMLLTGKALYEGNATQKLILHQTGEIPSLRANRPDLAPELGNVLQRMLAKRPDDRFQSAAEVALALLPWCSPNGASRLGAGFATTQAGATPEVQKALSGLVAAQGDRPASLSTTPRPWPLPTRTKAPSSKVLPGPLSSGAIANGPIAAAGPGSSAVLDAGARTGRFGGATSVIAPVTERVKRQKPAVLVASLLAGMLVLGAVAAAMLSGGTKAKPTPPALPPVAQGNPEPAPKPAPTPKPAPKPKPAPEAPKAVGLREDFAGLSPFAATLRPGELNAEGFRPLQVEPLDGAFALPAGWSAYVSDAGTVARAEFAENAGGSRALGLSVASGPASLILFSPTVGLSGPKARVTVEYRTEPSQTQGIVLRFRETAPTSKKATDLGEQLPATNGEWRTAVRDFDSDGATAGTLEVHPWGTGAGQPLWLRRVEVGPAPAAPTPPPTPAGPEPLARTDFGALTPFVSVGRQGVLDSAGQRPLSLSPVAGEASLPPGWRLEAYDPSSVVRFEVNETGGRKALCVRHTEGKSSAILLSPDLPAPGGKVRFRLVYRSDAKPGVKHAVRVKPIAAGAQVFTLDKSPGGTGGEWTTWESVVDLGGAPAVRFEFHFWNAINEAGVFISLFEMLPADGPPVSAAPPPAPAPAAPKGDFAGLAPFAATGRLGGTDARGMRPFESTPITGTPALPAGWKLLTYDASTVVRYEVAEAGGRPALALRYEEGKPTAMLFTPEVPLPGGPLAARFDYRSEAGRGSRYLVKFKPLAPNAEAYPVGAPPLGTGGDWGSWRAEFDPGPATKGRFEFHYSAPDPGMNVWVSGFEVAPAAPPGSLRADFVSVLAFSARGRLGEVNDSGHRPFVPEPVAGTPDLPAGWEVRPYDAATVVRYDAAEVAGRKALGVRNADGPTSGMLLSPVQKLSAKVRVTLTYRTEGDHQDGTHMKLLPLEPERRDAVRFGEPLPPTGGEWKTWSGEVECGGATAGRFELHFAGAGPESPLWLAAFEVAPAQ